MSRVSFRDRRPCWCEGSRTGWALAPAHGAKTSFRLLSSALRLLAIRHEWTEEELIDAMLDWIMKDWIPYENSRNSKDNHIR